MLSSYSDYLGMTKPTREKLVTTVMTPNEEASDHMGTPGLRQESEDS